MLAQLCAIYQGLTLAKDLAINEFVYYSSSLLCNNLIQCNHFADFLVNFGASSDVASPPEGIMSNLTETFFLRD
jgi:hypothetical protein